MNKFVFKSYDFNETTHVASFRYGFENGREFEERVQFEKAENYDKQLLDRALFLSFILAGTSYYKAFPSRDVVLQTGSLDAWQADFFNVVYQEGLSQFAYENQRTRDDLAHFVPNDTEKTVAPLSAKGTTTISLQSGGKDSLLTATMLQEKQTPFTPWYVSSVPHHPAVLDTFSNPLVTVQRYIDLAALNESKSQGALNGHVPVTYIIASYALIDAILRGATTVLLSIGHEGEEAHDYIGDLAVNHQWSKTWPAEKALSEYVRRYISPDIRIGSPLRGFSELKIAELFIQHAWKKYGHSFSSCNRANYMQGNDNTQLRWCGECPKCANSFLLFAPFLPAEELKSLFNGQDLFEKPLLQNTFKGLLGIDGVMKPFECVGETAELQLAYAMAQRRGGYKVLSFTVPESTFDYEREYEVQAWARQMV